MVFSKNDLIALASANGGSFAVNDLQTAYDFCRKVTLSHYENFPVGSILFPSNVRNHIFAVYAFARIADDIADEIDNESPAVKINLLENYESLLFEEKIRNPIFVALRNTIDEMKLPAEPFSKLILAFKMDSDFKQAVTISDLLNYCKYSANPVGEIILRLFGLYGNETGVLSDKICTALQLANFWQDISVDRTKNRIFIPTELLNKYDLNEENLFESENSVKLMFCLNELFDFTDALFREGEKLIKYLKPFRLKMEIKLTVSGGMEIMKKIRKQGIGTINSRPKLLFINVLKIFLKSFF